MPSWLNQKLTLYRRQWLPKTLGCSGTRLKSLIRLCSEAPECMGHYGTGVAVSSNCSWRLVVASSEEKIRDAFRSGTMTLEVHLFCRITGGSLLPCSRTVLAISAETFRARSCCCTSRRLRQSILVPTSAYATGLPLPDDAGKGTLLPARIEAL